jgi:hypothetical protein
MSFFSLGSKNKSQAGNQHETNRASIGAYFMLSSFLDLEGEVTYSSETSADFQRTTRRFYQNMEILITVLRAVIM